MRYEPVKEGLDDFFSRSLWLKKLFFRLLDLYLLRAWYVHRELRGYLKQIGPEPRILDAGCGFGQYSWYLSRKHPGARIIAVDVSDRRLRGAERFFKQAGRENVDLRCADLVAYRQPGFFDLILAVDVLEHIAEDGRVFGNFREALKPGGMLLISTPSDKGGSGVPEGRAGRSFIEEHVRNGYSADAIRQRLTASGFGGIETRYTYGIPGRISWILLMKIPVTLLNRSRLFVALLPLYLAAVYPLAFILNCLDIAMTHTKGSGLLVKAFKQTAALPEKL